MERNYGGAVWTDHALQRLKERGISQGDAYATWRNPDQSRPGKSGLWIYYKTYGNQKVEVVTKKDSSGREVIVTVWSRPVYVTQEFTKTNKTWDNLLEKSLNLLFGWITKK